jgi:hypothetical protein
MNDYSLKGGYYGLPTPAGAYQAVSSPDADLGKHFLLRLLSEEESPALTSQKLVEWTGLPEQNALKLLYHLQELALVEGHPEPVLSPQGPLEQVLPDLLNRLSGDGKALLADSQGFYLTSVGFPHETAEELSALSADLSGLYSRHQKLLHNNLGIPSSHWALVNAAGNSEIGFWQFFIGTHRFTLILSGVPQLNQSLFTRLVWSLAKRYAQD